MTTTRRDFVRNSTLLASTLASADLLCGAEPAAGKVKVGLVGTAHPHALGKLATLLKLAELYEVVGIVEPDERRRTALTQTPAFAALAVMTEEHLINVAGIQAVLVETEVKEVVPTALRLAEAGLHIHAEKPCGPSLPAFAQLLDVVRKKGRILQTGYMLRRNPAFEFCFRAVREGLLGNIFEINGIMGRFLDPAERRNLALFSGGAMFELGCHLIDAVVGLLGKPQAVQSYLRIMRPQQDKLADNTLAVFEYPQALATIRSCALDVEGNTRRTFVVCGDQGAITILPLEPGKLTLTLAKPLGDFRKGTQPIELRKSPGRYEDQLVDFARMIRHEKELDYPAEHDLAVLETVLRASGMPVGKNA